MMPLKIKLVRSGSPVSPSPDDMLPLFPEEKARLRKGAAHYKLYWRNDIESCHIFETYFTSRRRLIRFLSEKLLENRDETQINEARCFYIDSIFVKVCNSLPFTLIERQRREFISIINESKEKAEKIHASI